MSKRDLKKYLASLDKEQIEEQLLELYDKFPDVKTYYDFVFNPKEEKLVSEAKLKISNEYFPIKTKRAKLRRSTAQKYIKHFLILGVDPFAVADVMLYTMEVAQKYSARREMRYASFYKSMLNSFEQAVNYTIANGIVSEFRERIGIIFTEVQRQKWENSYEFERVAAQLEPG
ncbi:MAG TPA: DUF6155 family protein [Flavobacterium sp.]|nr:DUF6155 family protein [Flavobacterium sp.]